MSDSNISSSLEANHDNDDPELRRSGSPVCRTRQSPNSSVGSFSATRSSLGSGASSTGSSASSFNAWLGYVLHPRTSRKRKTWYQRRAVLVLVFLVAFFLAVNSWMLYRIQDSGRVSGMQVKFLKMNSSTLSIREELEKLGKGKRPQKTLYARLLAKAAHALAEGQNKPEPKDLWDEPYRHASFWKPCADQREWEPSEGNNGYIMVSANGGINQQRVAVCNAVAVARLLNATLVLPNFLFSSVWRDTSQFGDIYEEDYFINYLKPDVRIVKELPKELRSLDLEAIGSLVYVLNKICVSCLEFIVNAHHGFFFDFWCFSQVTDADIVKEAKPGFYKKYILPILHVNRVVHFVGFGNRLASDPTPFQLQKLRCRCNFYALRFVPKIQEAGALLVKRMRQNVTRPGPLDNYLLGSFAKSKKKWQKGRTAKASRYLALHLRFEIDMVAHSLCKFGGGEEERQELEAYRKTHFPALVELKKAKKLPSPAALRAEGLCPLMPEETALMLAALGFNRGTPVYLAGSHIYGGKSRLAALTTLFPNLVTKENLLSSKEIEPFMNFSSQLAAVDFIACTAADVFAMTDSGSQFSSLISGYRVYYGGGKMPTIRPNKRRLADIFVKNNTIEWRVFEQRVRKAVRQNKRVFSRPVGRSVYRYPRCPECMCNTEEILHN